MKYKDEREIDEMIRTFECGSIPRSDWHHEEHLIVACRYVFDLEFPDAVNKMRAGILALLKAFNVPDDKESPYNETLTVFWVRAVDNFRRQNPDLTFFETCRGVTKEFDKDFPFRFYSRERLFSADARRTFIEPDLVALNNPDSFD